MSRKRPKQPQPEPSGEPNVNDDKPQPNEMPDELLTVGDLVARNKELKQRNRELVEQLGQLQDGQPVRTVVADAHTSDHARDLADSEASRAALQRDLNDVKQRLWRMRELALPAMVFSVSLLGMFGLSNLTPDGMKRYKELCDLIPEMEGMQK